MLVNTEQYSSLNSVKINQKTFLNSGIQHIFYHICFLKFLFIALNYYMNAKLREKVSHETRNQLTKQIYFFENAQIKNVKSFLQNHQDFLVTTTRCLVFDQYWIYQYQHSHE